MELINVDKKLKKEELNRIKQVLDTDGIIIFPTDTVYGLACSIRSEKAIKKIFEIKKRNSNKPINVLTNSIDNINQVATNITKQEETIMNKYFPGELTIILKKKQEISDVLTSNKDTIGVRIPNSDIALDILKTVNYPLATTSVNLSNEPAGVRLEDFYETFKDKVDIIINGGKLSGVASTIIEFDNGKIKTLREGNIIINNN